MTTPADPLVGRILERRYRIDSPIARGGMSAVYVGTDLRLHRRVAVKVMDARYVGDPQFLRRFEFEARAVAGLSHTGLVGVYDQSIDGDIAFLVMELVRGGSLRELLRERGPMPPHAIVAAAAPVLGALGTAHQAGLVHRDVKPENVLISDTGDVKIADFGLVRAVAEAGITSASIILGTAAYLSPEQVTATEIDARSDVYSTGVMLYELLTGRQPFAGQTQLALAYQRLTYDVPAPGDVVPGVPPELDEVILRATERDPADRYPDGFAMRRALLDVAHELGLPGFTVPAPQHAAARVTAAIARPVRYTAPEPYDARRHSDGRHSGSGDEDWDHEYDDEYSDHEYGDGEYGDSQYRDSQYEDDEYGDGDHADDGYGYGHGEYDDGYGDADHADNNYGYGDDRHGDAEAPRSRPAAGPADPNPAPRHHRRSALPTLMWLTAVLIVAALLASTGFFLATLR